MYGKLVLAGLAVFFALPAYSADLPSEKNAPAYAPPPPAFSWTGVYLGGQVGYGWGRNNWDTYNAVTTNVTAIQPADLVNGVVGGAHVGYNWQFSQFVFGLEGDVDGSNARGAIHNNDGAHSLETRSDIAGAVRGRVGYAWDRVLIYAAGGAAFAPIQTINTNVVTGGSDSYTHTLVGWTVGGGLEYSIDNNWSVRAEYRYTDFSRFSGTLFNSSASGIFGNRFHLADNLVQAGFSYKFDWPPLAPVLAKY